MLRKRHENTVLTCQHETNEADAMEIKKINKHSLISSRTACHIMVAFVGFFISFYKIWWPAEVVFDEVHFGKFTGYYLSRTFYFDVHPPLGKMMFAAMSLLIGYDGHYDFAKIGESYSENNVPYVGLRALPASLNVASVTLMYAIMKQSGYSTLACVLSSCLYIFDNALVAQHRLILLDSSLVFYMLLTVYAYIRFFKLRHRSFTANWWLWMTAAGGSMGMTLSVKMVGLFVVGSVGVAVAVDLWNLLDVQNGLSLKEFGKHLMARVLGFIFVPTAVYLFWFYVHFAILNQSGPGDPYMSANFQASLENSPISLKSLDIHYYDHITLFHPTTSVYLHSHDHLYPRHYDDGRVGSGGQQVVGIPEADQNSYWQVKPTKDIPEDKQTVVIHGDIIQLEHVGTGKNLLTHNVASPLTRTNQEFTVVAQEEEYNNTLFKVVLDDSANGNTWKTHMKSVKLIAKMTPVALWTFNSDKLPEHWGFGLQEINGKKDHMNEKSAFWTAMDIRGKNATEINMKKKAEKPMNFIQKFVELQVRTIEHNAKLSTDHPYKSRPMDWPMMRRGISYWRSNLTKEQIYMTGNIFGWQLGLTAVLFFAGITTAQLLARQRNTHTIQHAATRQRLFRSAGFFWLLWGFHYLPFFVMGRSLYLHHYLPAVTCCYLLVGALFDLFCVKGINSPTSPMYTSSTETQRSFTSMRAHPTYWSYLIACATLSAQFSIFVFLAPITYGSPALTAEQASQRKMLPTWDLAFAT